MSALLLLWALVGSAWAGNWFEDAFFGINCEVAAVPYGPSEAIIHDALATNAALYGATSFTDDILLPNVARIAREEEHSTTIVGLRIDNLFGVQRVPVRATAGIGNCGKHTYLNAPVDLMSSRMGVAHQGKWFGAFYAVSVNGYGLHALQITRFTAPYMLFGANLAYGLVAPALPNNHTDGEQFNLVWDWIGGLSFSPGGVDLRVGYVGSRGLYTNIDETRSALFLRSVLQVSQVSSRLSELPYAAAGLSKLPLGEDAIEKAGRTQIFGRRLRWYLIPEAVEDPQPAAEQAREASFDLYTLHIEQVGISDGLVDARLILAARPAPFLHEAVVGLHSRHYDPSRPSDSKGGGGIWAGTVWMPAARYYDNSPGLKPSLVLDAGGPLASGKKGHIHAGLRLNQADILDVHPYAVNATSVFIEYVAANR